MSSTVNKAEIEQFSKDAPTWWDESGPFSPLHRLNPARMSYIKNQICTHYGRDEKAINALQNLSVIDIGCGGGLVCEPLARMGAKVTGADADPVAIEVAKDHAAQGDLSITYFNESAESLILMSSPRKRGPSPGKSSNQPDPCLRRDDTIGFDVVLALEIIEHVDAPEDFVKNCARLCKPGGLVIFSTLNRTAKSFALGVVAAEYILRWVPKGTHNWKKFVKPSELSRLCRAANLSPHNIKGLIYSPLSNGFELSDTDIDVNYFMTAQA